MSTPGPWMRRKFVPKGLPVTRCDAGVADEDSVERGDEARVAECVHANQVRSDASLEGAGEIAGGTDPDVFREEDFPTRIDCSDLEDVDAVRVGDGVGTGGRQVGNEADPGEGDLAAVHHAAAERGLDGGDVPQVNSSTDDRGLQIGRASCRE